MINVHHVRFLCRCLLQFFSGFPLVICGKQKLTTVVVHLYMTSYIAKLIHMITPFRIFFFVVPIV